MSYVNLQLKFCTDSIKFQAPPPLGTTMSKSELNLLIDLIKDNKDMHLISNEIYSGTVFTSPSFVSVMEILKERNDL